MTIDPLSTSSRGGAGSNLSGSNLPGSNLAEAQRSFSQVLSRSTGRRSTDTPEDKAREAASQLVSTALVQPILERLRASNQAAAPFAPNQAERTFGAMLDTELAQRLTQSGQWPLVDAVASRLLRKPLSTGQPKGDVAA